MPLYPIELKIAGMDVLVVGGGPVAARKVDNLVRAGASVRVLSPAFVSELEHRGDIRRELRAYSAAAIANARLVFACTDDRDTNLRVAEDARAAGRWCNIADDPENSDFFVPAVLRRGDLSVAVGTAGAAPHLAARVRDELESHFGVDFGILVEELQRARSIVRARISDPQIRRRILATLASEASVEVLESDGPTCWRKWVEQIVQDAEHGKRG